MPVNILIAEDSPVQALVLKHILEEQGYEVSTADNGTLALEMAAAIRPALIISDVNMPEMNGYQLTAHIKSSPELQQTPVILVTSMSDPEDVIRGLNSGADSFVLKPYEKNYLLESVQQTLANLDVHPPSQPEVGVDIHFKGRKHRIKANTAKTINLLLSTYEVAIQRNKQLVESQEALRKRTAEVISAHRFLDSVIESDPNLISIKEAGTLRYTRINRAFEALIGIPRDEILGKRDHDIFSTEDSNFCLAIDREALESRAVLDIHEAPIHTRENGRRVLHTKKIAVTDEQGEPTHLLGISEDVTVQRALEGLVQKLNAKLAVQVSELGASNEDLESFSYSIAHDLRSPLSVIGGYVGLLQKQCTKHADEKSLKYLSAVGQSVKLMDTLINDLLAFSKLARQAVKKADVDMDLLVRKTLATTLQDHPEDRLPEVEQATLPPAQADGGLLAQVWANLISNAVKYSSKTPKPRIKISGRREGSELIYTVQDNGAGFDMAHYDKLFGIFERLHGNHEFEGTGIGLAIVHRVVKHHGGRVWAEGKVNDGAIFSFALPA